MCLIRRAKPGAALAYPVFRLRTYSPALRDAIASYVGVVGTDLSADHLVATPPEHVALLAESATVAVALPGTPFGLGKHEFTPARATRIRICPCS